MALPFLPEHEIVPMFQILARSATSEPLQNLVEYIRGQWIESSIHPPKDWSIYGQPIRTNNDIEGWHNALNRRAAGKQNLPFYLLIHLLYREAELSYVQIRLVSDKKLKRVQRRKYLNHQQKIFAAWRGYGSNEKTARQLLKCCAHLNGPARL